MRVAVANDHAGLELKRHLWKVLTSWDDVEAEDFGTNSPDSVDYPDFAVPVAKAVASGRFDRGILVCGSGIGMAIAANKVPGVRAVVCTEPLSARLAREHNDTNVLCLGGRLVGPEMASEILRVWLRTPFAGERHQRRIDKLESLAGAAETVGKVRC